MLYLVLFYRHNMYNIPKSNSFYMFSSKNYGNPTKKQKDKLDKFTISSMSTKALRTYSTRQSFQEIYQAKTEDEFIIYLNK